MLLLLLLTAGGYGYHRDELYFLRAGAEPAVGYVDQPPLTPLLAHALDVLFDGSLVGLRLPSALMAALVVLLTGLIAREFGAGRGAQLLAAGGMAVSAVLPSVGHLLSTTTVDLVVWTAVSWLVVRGLRDGGPVWLGAGLVAGIGLENKLLPAFLLAALLVGVLVAGPRPALRSPWLWLGGALGLGLWAPNLVWQVTHGFPLAATPVVDVNYDAGETVGWPQLAATVAGVRRTLPAGERVAVLTENYGQAGAVDRFLPALAPAHSGHNAYWDWDPPPDDATSVIVVGFRDVELQAWFGEVELAARVDNGVGLANDEQGTPVWVAREPGPWSTLWPRLRRLG